jgi:hypothetical protein
VIHRGVTVQAAQARSALGLGGHVDVEIPGRITVVFLDITAFEVIRAGPPEIWVYIA